MKDEIKEILMSMEFGDGKNYQLTSEITISEWNKIIDYITNLQEEVEWYENIEINKTIDKFRLEHNKEIKRLQKENEGLKNLEYKFFDCSGDEESFTLEDYLQLGNKLYDLERENERLRKELDLCKKNGKI